MRAGRSHQSGVPVEVLAYNAALIGAFPFLGSYLLWRVVHGKSREGWAERWGHLPEGIRSGASPRVWVHASSVGEVSAARPIIRALRARCPGADVVMTVITPGGREVADSLVGKEISATAYLPFDLPWLVSRAVVHIKPDLFAGIETEIWPNLLWALQRHGARAALVNARLSDRSLPRYRRVRRLIRWALSAYDRVLPQSDEDARRFLELGSPEDRTMALGNVKFDEADKPLSADEVASWRRELCLPDDARVWIAGSTRVLAEERLVWQAHQAVLRRVPDAVLIHAPRHVDRADEVERGMRGAGLEPVRRSRLSAGSCLPRTIILDTFGELGKVYAVADIAFIGNSMVRPGGGQNLLQPLAQGKGVLFGPYMNNFRDAVALAVQAKVGFPVEDSEDLASRVAQAFTDAEWRVSMARRALDLVERNRGASQRYADALLALLPDACRHDAAAPSRQQ